MPYLHVQITKGKKYYSIRHNKRTGKKVSTEWSIYLGPEDKVLERLQKLKESGAPDLVNSFEFGASASFLAVADELGFTRLVDAHFPEKRQGALSVGEYLLLAVLHRLLEPGSKSQLARWFEDTFLFERFRVSPELLSSQNFWNNLSALDEASIDRIEASFRDAVLQKYDLSPACLLYDATNYFTYLRHSDRADLAKAGNSKEKRFNLRIVNLSLLVTRKEGMPLVHSTYPGNINDVTHFPAALRAINEKLGNSKACGEGITLVFDKGNNSEDNIQDVLDCGFKFVGSLRPSSHADLLRSVPLKDYDVLFEKKDEETEVRGYRLTKTVYDTTFTLVLTHDPDTEALQAVRLDEKLAKILATIETELASKLNVKKWRSRDACIKKFGSLLGTRKAKELIHWELTGDDGNLSLNYGVDEAALDERKKELGKTVIFTNRHEWSTAGIVRAYRSLEAVERDFREAKDVQSIRLRPQFCWTNPMIRVHNFTCYLALLLFKIFEMKLRATAPGIGGSRALQELKRVRLSHLVWLDPQRVKVMTEATSAVQQTLLEAFGVNR